MSSKDILESTSATQAYQKLLLMGTLVDLAKFCAKRCDILNNFESPRVSETESECLSKLTSRLRSERSAVQSHLY